MDLTPIAWPFKTGVNSLGEPIEELWLPDPANPQDLIDHAFEIPYGLPVTWLQDDQGDEIAFMALGHHARNWRRLVATANRHMRHEYGWANLLDDTTPGVLSSLRRPTETWVAFAIPLDHSAVPVTLLDLKAALDNPDRLRRLAADLRFQIADLQAQLAEHAAR
ncbi:hypothetical protein [Kitasatospora cathayae]|uniref:Uncharacterized protein n=1 Tax=Kitasatospora cathayae TaxID=3004092 RepID=A0ABY7QH87_9ACTN|nr:hypothetical protein [Kitasatospora sp. HUAS 3-15]WBP92205.1 hypothetical protein O1G21_41085 [Kitasatospora sp. HUAS 3-15]